MTQRSSSLVQDTYVSELDLGCLINGMQYHNQWNLKFSLKSHTKRRRRIHTKVSAELGVLLEL